MMDPYWIILDPGPAMILVTETLVSYLARNGVFSH